MSKTSTANRPYFSGSRPPVASFPGHTVGSGTLSAKHMEPVSDNTAAMSASLRFFNKKKLKEKAYGEITNGTVRRDDEHRKRLQATNDKAQPIDDLSEYPFNLSKGFASITDFLTYYGQDEPHLGKIVRLVAGSMMFDEPFYYSQASWMEDYINPPTFDMQPVMDLLEEEGFVCFNSTVELGTSWAKFNSVNLPYMTVNVSAKEYGKKDGLFDMFASQSIRDKLLDLVVPYLLPDEKEISICQLDGFAVDQMGTKRAETKMVNLVKDMDYALPEFYPWIKMGLMDYFREFFASKANVLVMLGDPGTGKSTLIRTVIKELQVHALVAYKTNVIIDDGFIKHCHDFLHDARHTERASAVIVEDADMIMGKRTDGNLAMSEILNATSGIASDSNSKFILSTNLNDIDSIDPALLRPGRCFDILCFRALTADEARAVRKARGLPELDFIEGRKYRLAEILNDAITDVKVESVVKPRFGFIK